MADLSKITLTNNTTVNIKDSDGRKEENLVWGGPSQSGDVSPVGMALSCEHSANKLAFINGAALTFEYSSDAGSTWTDYGYSDTNKSAFCTKEYSVPVGRASASTEYTTSSRTRITLTAQNGTTGYVYTKPRKILINVGTSGGMQVLVEVRKGADYQSSGAWSTLGTYTVSGWPGWNDIPLVISTLGGSSTQTNNYWQLRLTFIMTSVHATSKTTANILALRLFGSTAWTTPTGQLSKNGHIYSFDMSQNATFPANLKMNADKQVAYMTATPTTGKVVVTDGTSGGIKASAYTIGASVPSDAVFTDQNVSQNHITSNQKLPILLSSTNNSGTSDWENVAYRNKDVYVNPSSGQVTAKTFSAGYYGFTSTGRSDSNASSSTAIGTVNDSSYSGETFIENIFTEREADPKVSYVKINACDENIEISDDLKFSDCDSTSQESNWPNNAVEPGITWKENGYGDKFEIRPHFKGFDDDNFLGINASTGAAGTDPDVTNIAKLSPSGDLTLYPDVDEGGTGHKNYIIRLGESTFGSFKEGALQISSPSAENNIGFFGASSGSFGAVLDFGVYDASRSHFNSVNMETNNGTSSITLSDSAAWIKALGLGGSSFTFNNWHNIFIYRKDTNYVYIYVPGFYAKGKTDNTEYTTSGTVTCSSIILGSGTTGGNLTSSKVVARSWGSEFYFTFTSSFGSTAGAAVFSGTVTIG